MSNSDSTSLWGNLRVGAKIAVIPIFFLFAVGLIVFSTVYTISGQNEDAVVIELMGRQRMLHQQQFARAILVSQGRISKDKLDYTRKVWLDTQNALLNGGPAIYRIGSPDTVMLPKVTNPQIRRDLQEQQNEMETSIKRADELLAVSPLDPEYNQIVEKMIAGEQRIQELGSDIAKGATGQTQQKAENLVRAEIAIGAIVGTLGLLLSWIIAGGVTGPLQRVVSAAENIARGNLRIDKLQIAHKDEVGQLSRAFDNMLDNIKDLNGQILTVTGNVNSAAAEILASTQQQASSTKEQAATVQEISTTMQEISQSGAEITEKAKQVAASAEATSSVSNSGIAAVQNASRLMEGIRQQVEQVAAKIVSLSEKTQAIGEIVSTVNDIAEQSNLLALNASIEAASAGEQGSRFSVVANEMKHLAERAKESTVQVASILGDIQKGINSSVMLAEEAVKRSDTGKQQAEVTEKTIHQMMQTTVESINAFQQIIGATSQQQIGFDQVTQGMRDIRQATEQTAVGTSQLEKALGNLNELSLQLRSAVGRYQV